MQATYKTNYVNESLTGQCIENPLNDGLCGAACLIPVPSDCVDAEVSSGITSLQACSDQTTQIIVGYANKGAFSQALGTAFLHTCSRWFFGKLCFPWHLHAIVIFVLLPAMLPPRCVSGCGIALRLLPESAIIMRVHMQ